MEIEQEYDEIQTLKQPGFMANQGWSHLIIKLTDSEFVIQKIRKVISYNYPYL
jgi:hypothetical protein